MKRFLKAINPEIINLIGTENPYYSITSLDIKNIPVYVSEQTVYTNPLRKLYSDVIKLNWDTELKIHQKELYFGCTGRMHRDLILSNNPKAIIFKMFFPIEKPSQVKEVPKIFDFVFFAASITKKKGIEDAIDALAIVQRKHPNVTLNVVGRCNFSYKGFLLSKITHLGLNDHVIFNEYFPVHADMHQQISRSRFALLPIKFDVISSTVIEAIFLNLPVVTNKTTGTPYLNRDGEAVLISEIGDIESMAANMFKLLENHVSGDKLATNARKFVEYEFNNTSSAKRLLNNYSAVIKHYKNGTQLPQEQLFNIEEFPIY